MTAVLTAACMPSAFAQQAEEVEPVGLDAEQYPVLGNLETVYTPDGVLYDLSGDSAQPLAI